MGALTAAGVDAQIVVPVTKPPPPSDRPARTGDLEARATSQAAAASGAAAAGRVGPHPAAAREEPRSVADRRGSSSSASRDGAARLLPPAPALPPWPARARTPRGPRATPPAPSAAYRAALLGVAHAVDRALEPTAKVRLEGACARSSGAGTRC